MINKNIDPLQSGLREEAFELWATYARSNQYWPARLRVFHQTVLINNFTSLQQLKLLEEKGSLAIKEFEDNGDFAQQARQFREMTFGEMYVLLTRLTSLADDDEAVLMR